MATFPSIETVLMEIHQSLGLKQDQTKIKKKFGTGNMRLAEHQVEPARPRFKLGPVLARTIWSDLKTYPQEKTLWMFSFAEERLSISRCL